MLNWTHHFRHKYQCMNNKMLFKNYLKFYRHQKIFKTTSAREKECRGMKNHLNINLKEEESKKSSKLKNFLPISKTRGIFVYFAVRPLGRPHDWLFIWHAKNPRVDQTKFPKLLLFFAMKNWQEFWLCFTLLNQRKPAKHMHGGR